MTNRLLASGFIVCVLLAATPYSQGDGAPEPATASRGLKDAYAGAFLIGMAGDIPRGYSGAELANIKANYNIVTPENCMKPQPTHPSEDTYNFTTPDALVQWCQDNGILVWGHTLAWHSQTAPWFFQAPASETEAATAPETLSSAEANSQSGRGGFGGFGGFGQRGISGPPASREIAMERLKKHIMTVVGRYKGRIKAGMCSTNRSPTAATVQRRISGIPAGTLW
ncbi:MAG: endo-1,4-beta-xylanase [Acidobacteriota bacterium]